MALHYDVVYDISDAVVIQNKYMVVIAELAAPWVISQSTSSQYDDSPHLTGSEQRKRLEQWKTCIVNNDRMIKLGKRHKLTFIII